MDVNEKITLVIPAAGRGTRLFPGANSRPKGMIPINGRPLLEYVLDTGLQLPIGRIVIVISPTGKSIREYFGPTQRGIRIHYAIQDEPRGLADAVSCAEPYVEQLMLVINGDEIFVGGRCGEIYRYFQERQADGVVGYLQTTPDDPRIRLGYGLELGTDGRVRRLVEKPSFTWNGLLGVGVWLLCTDFFTYFPRTPSSRERGERDFVGVIQRMIADGYAMYGMDLGAEFVNVNAREDLMRAEATLKRVAQPVHTYVASGIKMRWIQS